MEAYSIGSAFTSVNASTGETGRIPPWEEEVIYWNFRRWHIILLSTSAALSVVIFFCCIFKCRVPRTKQEIEADFIRRQLTANFRRQLKNLKNSELDDMDFRRALDRLREEFRMDTASIAHSEGFSALSFSPDGTPTYRKGSDMVFDASLENIQTMALNQDEPRTIRERASNFFSSLRKFKP